MDKIIGIRACGKTLELIKQCAKNNGQIICLKGEKDYISDLAEANKLCIKPPICYKQFMEAEKDKKYQAPYYIDDIECFLIDLFGYGKVGAISLTSDDKGETEVRLNESQDIDAYMHYIGRTRWGLESGGYYDVNIRRNDDKYTVKFKNGKVEYDDIEHLLNSWRAT